MRRLGFRPLANRVVVQRDASEEKTAGGIVIPDEAKEKLASGVVLAAGAGKWRDDGTREPMTVRVGDRVVFERYSGEEVKLDGIERLLVMREDAVSGVEES